MIPASLRIAGSRAVNILTGGRPGATFSAQSEYRARRGAWGVTRAFGRACVGFINWFTRDPDHCFRAYRLEVERGGFPA